MTLPRGIRWWLVRQRQLSFHLSPLPLRLYLLPNFFFFLHSHFSIHMFPKVSKTLVLPIRVTQHTDMRWHRDSFLVFWFHSGVQQWQPHLRGVCVCDCVCFCVLGVVRPVLVDSGASNYCPSVTTNYSRRLLTHTACLCACVCGCVSLTSCCVMLTRRATSIRLWLGRPGTIFITFWGKSYCSRLSQYHRISQVTILLLCLRSCLIMMHFESWLTATCHKVWVYDIQAWAQNDFFPL